MASVGSYEAKTYLPSLLERVAKGEQITITKHGVPIARIVPIAEKDSLSRADAIQRLRLFSKGKTLGGLSVREMMEEGRR
ncbi:antitoxin [Capsulimonas corticalis]|uniref:Antitoxin n=1 Tax=Capsulimonas corticalis TaxID=2219043 RepID=A0A402D2S2_9BACT|nr:type II toxin-antitoxin system prevent-host-death family antitoxin [Capsulimonas corticalis]BDI29916.1 antitoxin [Capsulimonas corticalis]